MSGFKYHLNAHLGQQCIGALSLTEDNELHFNYSEIWQRDGYALSPYLPLDNSASNDQYSIRTFFQNLFPEGENLSILLNEFRLSRSNTFGITQVLGSDLAGALQMVLEPALPPVEAIFRSISDQEIVERLKHQSSHDLLIWDKKLRLSLAGVHQKINVVIREDGAMGFGEGALCSTHILKFESSHVRHLVMNEYQMMSLAKAIGLPVADVSLKYFDVYPTLLVKRFDRAWRDGHVVRRHVIDGCQALNLMPDYKYERHLGSGRDVAHIRDGASLPQLFAFCGKCKNPVLAKKQLLNWVLFNIIIGNADAHAKNITFFISSSGIELAPAYDLISIRAYPEFNEEWAMALGDEFNANKVGAYELADFADSCGIARIVVAKALHQLCERVEVALPRMEYDAFTEKLRAGIACKIKELKTEISLISKVVV